MQGRGQFHRDVTRNTRALRKAIGRNIHTLRLKRGMTLETLSRRCAVSIRQIDYLEMGKSETDLRHVVSLAMGLRVEARDLLVFQNNLE